MARTTTMIVRVSGVLSEFVAANVGEDGAYENVSEYIQPGIHCAGGQLQVPDCG